ncbi:hypothetical protein L6452_20794 [Arctium lappa]|uniref:Uncharacterized protein n=1 Tax=Arctium lappa TaxID=4217 RepID=A0ACB9BD86_ARCLA|nr:hypothetical protein L6452_20794 [Arctium lappa]
MIWWCVCTGEGDKEKPFWLGGFKLFVEKFKFFIIGWSFEAFIRGYYAFLDQKSSFLYLLLQQQKNEQKKSEKSLILYDLVWLHKLQRLLDMSRSNHDTQQAQTCSFLKPWNASWTRV